MTGFKCYETGYRSRQEHNEMVKAAIKDKKKSR